MLLPCGSCYRGWALELLWQQKLSRDRLTISEIYHVHPLCVCSLLYVYMSWWYVVLLSPPVCSHALCVCVCMIHQCTTCVCVWLSPFSRCMGWWGPAPRLAGDLRLIRGLFLARPHWHHTVPPTCCLWQPAHLSQRWARHWAGPTAGDTGLPQTTQWGERTPRP